MNARILILVCLLALFIAAPAHAADIILDGACTLHDAITAANTDAPAGNCPAGSGADTIRAVWETREIKLTAPLPPITSTISIVMHDPYDLKLLGPFPPAPPAPRPFYVASGGRLTLRNVHICCTGATYGGAVLVERGGRLDFIQSSLKTAKSTCGGAIYNEGMVNLTQVPIISSWLVGQPAIYNRGNLNLSGVRYITAHINDEVHTTPKVFNDGGTVSLSGTDPTSVTNAGTCAPIGSAAAAVSRPAPECKLEPQLQPGDRAIRSGRSYSNLRAEAGISGERVGRIEAGAVVDVIEGPVDADGYNWYRVTGAGDELEGWVAEAPARSFNCAYYFVGFDGELPPAAPDPIPDRQACDLAEPLAVGGWALIAGKTNINYRAEAGLAGARSGTLAPGTVLELLDGPEDADGYEWWQVRNVVAGIEGWLAQGGQVSSGECLRWLLPLATDEDIEAESDMDESAGEMMDEDEDETEPEASADEDSGASSS
ncbi:MAG: SH3 domain-containing protein [Chloroflexi bacterium]|nr:SH3 domain-containing protein [Chloroflexota bacterium]